VPWARLRDKPHNFIQQEYLEEGSAGIKEPELYDTDTLRNIIRLFIKHQKGTLSYDRGLIFLPCGTGTELHYSTKKGKGKGGASKPFIHNIQIIRTNFGKLSQKPRPRLLPLVLPLKTLLLPRPPLALPFSPLPSPPPPLTVPPPPLLLLTRNPPPLALTLHPLLPAPAPTPPASLSLQW
jgi:hypothetical protein